VALALGMQVAVADPFAKVTDPRITQASFTEVLAGSDIVVCLAISDASTRHLFNAAAFATMKPGARFINLSRGELVDEAALIAALDSKHLAGAAMDVGSAPDQRPNPALAARADVVATPHIGGMTPEAMEHQAMDTVRQIASLARGEMPEGTVNAEAAFRVTEFLARTQR
jgi:D-3-phosphoglycerate dehydrogenase